MLASFQSVGNLELFIDASKKCGGFAKFQLSSLRTPECTPSGPENLLISKLFSFFYIRI